MLAEAFPLGSWKSVIEMERYLTMEELNLLLTESRKREERDHRFHAAIQGIDLDKEANDVDRIWEETKAQAEADLAGKTKEEMFFEFVGIEFDEDED